MIVRADFDGAPQLAARGAVVAEGLRIVRGCVVTRTGILIGCRHEPPRAALGTQAEAMQAALLRWTPTRRPLTRLRRALLRWL